jgi:8-oxo-dGTP diphosphatase
MPLLVVRHAHAGRRSAYDGDDARRPLSAKGVAQATGLVPLLVAHRPRRILSSPAVRCYETVRPTATALDLPVESVGELAEERCDEAVALLHRMAGESAVLCTHGDVALALLDDLAGDRPAKVRQALRLQKGDLWVVRSVGSTLSIVDHLRPGEGGTGPAGAG